MAINLDNLQFKQFTDFAQSVSEKTIVKAGVLPAQDGQPRTIVAKGSDFKGNVGRLSESRNINDEVRTIFRSAIAEMFGGENHIPESVRDAMKMQDYGENEHKLGKPLTARRILAVKAAVDQIRDSIAQAKVAAQDFYNKPGVTAEQVDALIEGAIRECGNDRDAMEIVVKTMGNKLLEGGNASLRSLEGVQQQVMDIKASLAELRAVAKGDAAKMNAGKQFIASFGGKSVPNGLVSTLFRAADKMNVGDLKGLTPNANGIKIHKAVSQFMGNINAAMNENGIGEANGFTGPMGADEMDNCRALLADLMLSKCGSSAIAKMRAGLQSDNAKKVASCYDQIWRGDAGDANLPRGLGDNIATTAYANMKMLNLLNETIEGRFGVTGHDVQPVREFDGDFDNIEFGIGGIFRDLKNTAKTKMDGERQAFLEGCVNGQGEGAKIMRDLFGAAITEAPQFGVEDNWNKQANRQVKAMLNWSLVGSCGKMASAKTDREWEETLFAKDVNRGLTIKLPGDVTLSTDFKTARDQLSSFVTGGVKARFSDLDAAEKNKAIFVMALLSQDTLHAVDMGTGVALDPLHDGNPITLGKSALDKGDLKKEFKLSFAEDGSLKLSVRSTRHVGLVSAQIGDRNFAEMVNEGSNLELGLDFSISKEDFDKFGGLDFTKFDDSKGREIRDAKGVVVDDRMIKVQDSLAPEFNLNNYGSASITSFYKPTLL